MLQNDIAALIAYNPLVPQLRMHREIPRMVLIIEKSHYLLDEEENLVWREKYAAMSVVLTIKVTGYSLYVTFNCVCMCTDDSLWTLN